MEDSTSDAASKITPETSRATHIQTGNSANQVESRLIRAQAIAGALFFVFLLMHLSNTVLAAVGAELYDGYQNVLQRVYQQPLIELGLVIFPLVVHAVAGVWLYVLRRTRRGRRALEYRLQSWAGLFLLVVVVNHALATRGVGYWFDAAPGFAGVSFSLWWLPAVFYPYYFLLFVAGLYHGALGVTMLLQRSGLVRVGKVKWLPLTLAVVGSLSAIIALLGFGGVLFEIHDPTDNDYARVYAELLGISLATD